MDWIQILILLGISKGIVFFIFHEIRVRVRKIDPKIEVAYIRGDIKELKKEHFKYSLKRKK